MYTNDTHTRNLIITDAPVHVLAHCSCTMEIQGGKPHAKGGWARPVRTCSNCVRNKERNTQTSSAIAMFFSDSVMRRLIKRRTTCVFVLLLGARQCLSTITSLCGVQLG